MLSGDLTDFSLGHVLRLLSTTGKSGLLTLHGAASDAGVFVRDGGICLALVDVTRVPLGPRMIMSGIADRETVGAAARAADGTVFGLACALVRGVPDADAASALAADHTRETIGWLSQYAAAVFEFDPTIAVEAWPFEPLGTEELLADIERSAHQWTELRGVVDDLSLAPSCVPDLSDGAALSLTARQWRIVALVDGRRTIKELVEAVGLGQLDTGRELAGLVGEGLVELIGPGDHSAVDVLLQDVRTVDAFSLYPAWMARDDDAPEQLVSDAPAGEVDGDARYALQVVDAPAPPGATSDVDLGLLNRLVGRSSGS